MQWAGGSAHYLSCTVQDVLGPHRTARGRAPPVRRGSAPRLGRVGFGRVGPLSRRLRSERGEPFQAVPSAELSSAGHLGKFEPGFGLVAKPAHPPGPPLGGTAASGRRKKSGPKPARALATAIGKGLSSGPHAQIVEMTAQRISRPRGGARHAHLPQSNQNVAVRENQPQICNLSEAWTA